MSDNLPLHRRARIGWACVVALLLLGGGFLVPDRVAGQPSPDSLRAAALRDYHGPDRSGKDGPLAKAGFELLLLYHEHKAFREHHPDSTFTPTVADVPVHNGRVGVEAVATDSAAALLADLEALGLTDGVTAGRLVSGWLPIEQIPALARLESLRGLIQPTMQTRPPPAHPSPDASGSELERDSAPSSGDGATGADGFVLLLSSFLLAVES